jgi:hypothetical protein
MQTVPSPWSSVETGLVLPIAEARAVFARAERFDVERGGRFDRRSACVLIWSTSAAAAESGEPVGAFWVRWHAPTEEQATVWKLEWDAAAGGTEHEVWTALEVLAGRPLEAP